MSIITNLDNKLSEAQVAEAERQERRVEFVKDKYDGAEKAVKNNTEQPDIIYSGFQRDDVYSADPIFDKSREAIVDAQSLPVKNYFVSPEGDFGIILDEGSAALEEVKNKTFCHSCGDRQPPFKEMWDAKAERLRVHAQGDPPADFQFGVMCCYCGARLGIEGDHNPSGITQLTPDQTALLEEMFGKIRQPTA